VRLNIPASKGVDGFCNKAVGSVDNRLVDQKATLSRLARPKQLDCGMTVVNQECYRVYYSRK
jgi:hypothetical protein